MSDLERLDPELEQLFAKERREHFSEPMIRDEVLERVERAIRMAALAPAAAAAPKAAAAASIGTKVVVGVALVSAFGGGVLVGRETAPARTASVPPVTVSAPSASPAPVVEAPPAISATPVGELPSASTALSRPASPEAGARSVVASDLAKEQALIDTARSALARGRGADALAAAEVHATRFPGGALAEEREALAIQALALDGKADAAKGRAARFQRRYPTSIFWPAVDRALSGL